MNYQKKNTHNSRPLLIKNRTNPVKSPSRIKIFIKNKYQNRFYHKNHHNIYYLNQNIFYLIDKTLLLLINTEIIYY